VAKNFQSLLLGQAWLFADTWLLKLTLLGSHNKLSVLRVGGESLVSHTEFLLLDTQNFEDVLE
jgi:hypothetical protein